MGEKITLVGGGLAGSLLSIYLAKRGYDVHLFERRPDMRDGKYEGGRSINLALSLRGITALQRVGLDKEVLDISIPMAGRMMHDTAGNTAYQPYGKEGQHIYSVSRSQLNIRLLQLADQYPNITLYFNHKCVEANLKTNELMFQGPAGERVVDTSDVVIATDGAFSAVREAMLHQPRFSYSQTYENYGYKELEIVPDVNGKFQLDENCLHIWPRKSFMMIALPNPGGNFTCTLFMPFDGNPGIDQLQTSEEITAFFKEHFGDALPMMPNLVEDYQNNPTGMLVTVRCYPWAKNNVALLGDAAHAVVPFYGQGMNCSFEDCLVLDDLIGMGRPNTDWSEILHQYQQKRKPNADAIANLALQNFVEMRDLVGSPEFLHRKKVEHVLSTHYPNRFTSQYERTTFSTRDYAEAWEYGGKNDKVLDTIIQNGWESKLEDTQFINQLLQEMLG